MLDTHQRFLESQELTSRIAALEHHGTAATAVELVAGQDSGTGVVAASEGAGNAQ
jgi:hypothetical protein